MYCVVIYRQAQAAVFSAFAVSCCHCCCCCCNFCACRFANCCNACPRLARSATCTHRPWHMAACGERKATFNPRYPARNRAHYESHWLTVSTVCTCLHSLQLLRLRHCHCAHCRGSLPLHRCLHLRARDPSEGFGPTKTWEGGRHAGPLCTPDVPRSLPPSLCCAQDATTGHESHPRVRSREGSSLLDSLT